MCKSYPSRLCPIKENTFDKFKKTYVLAHGGHLRIAIDAMNNNYFTLVRGVSSDFPKIFKAKMKKSESNIYKYSGKH